MNNKYLAQNLDSLIGLADMMWEVHGKFVSELIHSSFFLAVDEGMDPLKLSINNEEYAFIFTSPEEFDMAYPSEDVPAIEMEFSALVDFLEPYGLDGYILNVSSQNFYMTRKFLKRKTHNSVIT